MAQTSESNFTDTDRQSNSTVRAQLAIEPHPDSNCVVVDATDETRDVSQQIKATPESVTATPTEAGEYNECHTELSTSDNGSPSRSYLTSEVHEKCICPVLADHECIPEVTGVRGNTLIISLIVPKQTVLRELLADLRDIEATVSVEWLVHGNPSETLAELDVSSITPKQQTALETALEMGYYETPRETDLATLSEELGISKSAVSQRLNSAETKLVKAFTST